MKLRSIRSSFHRLRFFCPALAAFSAAGVVNGQDGAASLPELPSGFYEAAATVIGDGEEPSFGKLDFELELLSRYDSNVTQGNDIGPRPEESDFLVQPTLGASYEIGPGNWQLGFTGSVGRINYLETDDFNATVYSAGFLARYRTGKVTASLKTNYADDAGVNRFAGAFLEQKNFLSSAKINYRLSSKTSAEISWFQQSNESVTDGFGNASSSTFNAAALWQATPLIRMGPGFRYGVRTGSGLQDNDFKVAGPVLRTDYNLSTKVNLISRVGLDFAEAPFGEDELLNYQVGLTYRASKLWAASLQMARDTQATFISGGGFDQVSIYQFSYNRKIRRASLRLGVEYVNRDPQETSGVALGFRDSNFVDYTVSLGFPIIGDEVDLQVNLAWRELTASDDLRSWDAFQSGFSLDWRF